MIRIDIRFRRSILGCLVLAIAFPAGFVRAAEEKPLTQEQLIELSTGPLKSYPDEVVNYVNKRGVTFFPTNSNLRWLEKAGVHQSVITAVRRKVASQMRIKICRFTCDDESLARKFEEAMIRRLINTKQGEIAPFGFIPLDRNPGPPGGFDSNVKPEPNVFYILLQGWIHKTSSGFSLDPLVIFRDPSGTQLPLPDAANPPKTLTMQTLESVAGDVINWGINTVRIYGET